MSSAPRDSYLQLLRVRCCLNFASDVVIGLSHPGQKELPSKYLYDEVGSALFDVICLLPEYGLSRAGMRMLETACGRNRGPRAGPGGRCGAWQRQRTEDAAGCWKRLRAGSA